MPFSLGDLPYFLSYLGDLTDLPLLLGQLLHADVEHQAIVYAWPTSTELRSPRIYFRKTFRECQDPYNDVSVNYRIIIG
jgi:hypothetical protein